MNDVIYIYTHASSPRYGKSICWKRGKKMRSLSHTQIVIIYTNRARLPLWWNQIKLFFFLHRKIVGFFSKCLRGISYWFRRIRKHQIFEEKKNKLFLLKNIYARSLVLVWGFLIRYNRLWIFYIYKKRQLYSNWLVLKMYIGCSLIKIIILSIKFFRYIYKKKYL